ncbi:MAG: MFS transporter [Labilithrix sp.]|nr:MFS transporter [Labilithrix sp.]
MPLDASGPRPTSERAIVFCVGAVQFVNILDFMIVMPLGPDFAKALGIPLSQLGYVGGSYTAAACVSGLAGAFFLDRFDRKKALGVTLAGLVLGTLAGAFARGLGTLMLARVVAGAFGGPATSLSYSIVADVIPIERRGKAMGAVMGAFSVASVLGVPAGLELARQGSWKMPFIAVALLGAVLGTFAQLVLPRMSGHLTRARPRTAGEDILRLLRPDVGVALMTTFFVMASGFVLIPNISAYLLGNLSYPREHLGLLYLAGGVVSFFALRGGGRLVDRHGSARVGTLGTLLVATAIYLGFIRSPPALPIMAIFVLFMIASGLRNVSLNTLMSRVPGAEERARFSSMQSAVQHLAASVAAFAAAQLLRELPGGRLEGIPTVASTAIALGALVVPLMWLVERRVKRKAASGG